jgi:hypothetical protein
MKFNRAKATQWAKANRLRIGAAIAVLIAIVVVIAATSGGDSKSAANGAEIVSVNELREKVAEGGAPAYWAGERPATKLELSQSPGQIYVRYLTGDAEAGDPRPAFLTIGTYQTHDPIAALRRQGRAPGGVVAKAGGATVYFSRTHPHSIYLAFPGVEAEIEVYDPSFKLALRLVNSGRIVPVG